MAIAEAWQQSLDDLRKKFEGITMGEKGWEIPPALKAELAAINAANWKNERLVFTFGQLDVDKMIAVNREGILPWWPALNGRVYFGDIEAAKKFHDAFTEDTGKGEKPNLSATMTWNSHPYTLEGGTPSKPDAKLLSLLLDWGANPMHDKGSYWDKVLRQSEPAVIRAFLLHGAARENIDGAVGELVKAKNFGQVARIQQGLGEGGFYTLVDNDTLLETKYIRDGGSDSVFKTLFNFRSRRVNEIYETGTEAEARIVMTATNFDQYDTQALRGVQERLEKLGGKPVDTLDKPRARLGAKP